MFRDPECRTVFHDALIICGVVALSTLTRNWATVGIVVFGVFSCLKNRPGEAICACLLMTFLQMVNPFLMPRYPHFAILQRLGSFAMFMALIASAESRHGRHRVPLGCLFAYLLVAVFSSTVGYYPLVSYLKLINFSFFILAIYVGMRNLHKSPDSIDKIRCFVLALVLVVIYGSLLTRPFPVVAYFSSIRSELYEYGVDYVNLTFGSDAGGKLFGGVTNNSQFLGPAVACCFAWVLCDMWLVKKKISWFHILLVLPIPIICYMTRSRISFFTLLVALFMTTAFCLPRAKVPRRVKSTFWAVLIMGFAVVLLGAAITEFKHGGITQWLRKTNDVANDERSLMEAVTESRQGLIAANLADFNRNRLIGTGFQVSYGMKKRLETSSANLFSATIEKGLLPLMVLGETGLIGAVVFLLFLAMFYNTCARRRYTATATLLTVFFATNMAESTFFAPSGGGGVLWLMMVGGGFAMDMQQYVTTPLPMPQDAFSEEDDMPGGAELDEEHCGYAPEMPDAPPVDSWPPLD